MVVNMVLMVTTVETVTTVTKCAAASCGPAKDWFAAHAEWSGWAQAIGAALAIAASFRIARLEHLRAEAERRWTIASRILLLVELIEASQQTLRFGGDPRLGVRQRLETALESHVYALDGVLHDLDKIEEGALSVLGVGGLAFNTRQTLRRQRLYATTFLPSGLARDDWPLLVTQGEKAAAVLNSARELANAIANKCVKLVSPWERLKMRLLRRRYRPSRAVEAATELANQAQAKEQAELTV